MGKKQKRAHDHDHESAVWIKTEPSVDGSTYVVTVEFDADRAVTLTPDNCLQYAAAVLSAAQRAEYDAAVFAQISKLTDQKQAAALILDLREDRPPLDTEPLKPMRLDPGVNGQGEPFLTVLLDDKPVGQWPVEAARTHALAALEAVGAADLDAGYYRALLSSVGVSGELARRVVEDIGSHRRDYLPSQ